MEKQSIHVPRPDLINAPDPNKMKRQPSGSFKAISAIGASRKDTEWGGAVDKIGSVMTKKATAILEKLAKKDMPSFLKQDRDPKAKEVYRALKKEHPEYSAGKKARIAESVANKA
jgi:hypothetical protein